MSTPDLYGTCQLGGLDLNAVDVAGVGYLLHADTRNARAVQWRKQTVENNWVEGSFDVSAVRQNIIENLWVWVYGSSHDDCERKITALTNVVSQQSFNATWLESTTTGTQTQEVWSCSWSEFTVETQREYHYANMALVKINLNRRPRVTRTYTDASTYVG